MARMISLADARRPVATREHRRFPLGWTAPEASVLAGVPKRTLQVWRKDGFFVPALPAALTGFGSGELFSLGDLVAVSLVRLSLDAGVGRGVVARVGEVAPLWDGDGFSGYRSVAVADDPWWYLVPVCMDLAPSPSAIPRVWFESRLEAQKDCVRDGGLAWAELDGDRFAVWVPVSKIAGQLAEAADRWRRTRRIRLEDWPPWM